MKLKQQPLGKNENGMASVPSLLKQLKLPLMS